jgi:hypothetical protein
MIVVVVVRYGGDSDETIIVAGGFVSVYVL